MASQSLTPFHSPIFRDEALQAYLQPPAMDNDLSEPTLKLAHVWGVVAMLMVMLLVIWPLGGLS